MKVSGARLYIGGYFSEIGSYDRWYVAALYLSAGGVVSSWDPPDLDGKVWAIDVSGDSVYIGGEFSNVGTSSRRRIAALNSSNGSRESWYPSISIPTSYEVVNTILVHGTTVYIGGEFNEIGGKDRRNLAAVDDGFPTKVW